MSKSTKSRLDELKEYNRETYDEVLNKMINIINITIRNPVAGARIFRNIKRKKQNKSRDTSVYHEPINIEIEESDLEDQTTKEPQPRKQNPQSQKRPQRKSE